VPKPFRGDLKGSTILHRYRRIYDLVRFSDTTLHWSVFPIQRFIRTFFRYDASLGRFSDIPLSQLVAVAPVSIENLKGKWIYLSQRPWKQLCANSVSLTLLFSLGDRTRSAANCIMEQSKGQNGVAGLPRRLEQQSLVDSWLHDKSSRWMVRILNGTTT
jgi:hypothetical protein